MTRFKKRTCENKDALHDFRHTKIIINRPPDHVLECSLGGFLFDLMDFGPKLVWVDFCLI